MRVSIEIGVLRRVLRNGVCHRRRLVGAEIQQKAETRLFAEYDPLCVHPKRTELCNFGAPSPLDF